MPDEPKAPAGSSGLHASAAPYVPAAAPAGKPNEGKAAGDAAPTSSSTAATATALNGNTPQPANSSSSSASQPAAAGGKGAGGQKGSKAAAKQQQQQQTPTSKLAAAASAVPFVPGSGGKPGECRERLLAVHTQCQPASRTRQKDKHMLQQLSPCCTYLE